MDNRNLYKTVRRNKGVRPLLNCAWLNVKRMRKCALLGLPFIFSIVLQILFLG